MLVFYHFLSPSVIYQTGNGHILSGITFDRCVWILVSIGHLFFILSPKIEKRRFRQWDYFLRFIWTRPYTTKSIHVYLKSISRRVNLISCVAVLVQWREFWISTQEIEGSSLGKSSLIKAVNVPSSPSGGHFFRFTLLLLRWNIFRNWMLGWHLNVHYYI